MIVIPNRLGTDVFTRDKTRDAHVRLEKLPDEDMEVICVDVFNGLIPREAKNLEAHIDSSCFPNSDSGARNATEYLKDFGDFLVEVRKAGSGVVP